MPAAASSRKGAGGPKTAAGKARSAQNARTHGLNVLAAGDPACASEIAARAQELAGPNAGPRRLALARAAAAADVDLRRIAAVRRRLFEAASTRPPPTTRSLIAAFTRLQAGQADAPPLGPVDPMADPGAARRLIRALSGLERYERQAFSRRRRALLALAAVHHNEASPSLDADGAEPLAAAPAFTAPRAPAAGSGRTCAAPADLAKRTLQNGAETADCAAAMEPAGLERATAPRAQAEADGAGAMANAAKQTQDEGSAMADQTAKLTKRTHAGAPAPAGQPAFPAAASSGGCEASQMVAAMAFCGIDPEAIARRLNLSVDELRQRYGPALDDGPDYLLARVADALAQRAISGNVQACALILRARGGWCAPVSRSAPPKPEISLAERRAVLARVMDIIEESAGRKKPEH